jgi:hypothetical protein
MLYLCTYTFFQYEFATYNESLRPESAKPFQNKLPVFRADRGGKLYEFVADPPTTTMQRLKGLTTGYLVVNFELRILPLKK